MADFALDPCEFYDTMCARNVVNHNGAVADGLFWCMLISGWVMFSTTLAALVKQMRKARRTIFKKGGVGTAANGLCLFSEIDYKNLVPPLNSGVSAFDLMWTEANQDGTVSKEVFGVQSLFMCLERCMLIVNDSEHTIFIKTPLSIPNLPLFVSKRKDLFPTRPTKLTMVVIKWSDVVIEGQSAATIESGAESGGSEECAESPESEESLQESK